MSHITVVVEGKDRRQSVKNSIVHQRLGQTDSTPKDDSDDAVKADNTDDDKWHELQMSKSLVIKKKIDEYVTSFTLHGLTKIVKGGKIESSFWFIVLFAGWLTCFTVVYGLISKFYRYEIYTEIRSVITEENYFPSVTFCENQLFLDSYFSYCGVAHRFAARSTGQDRVCSPASRSRTASGGGHHANRVSEVRNEHWSNGRFNVTKCLTWGGKSCTNSDYFQTRDYLNHSCITWNYAGNLSDVYSHVDIEFNFDTPSWLGKEELIIMLPHDHAVHEIDLTKRVKIEADKEYEIKLDKTLITRLPAPFPSKCSTSKGKDIFPGRYTRASCIETYDYLEMYKTCGDTLDYIEQFIPYAWKEKYKRNITVAEANVCFKAYAQGETKKASGCGFPCTDYDLSVIHSFNERKTPLENVTVAKFIVSIQYHNVDTYKTLEEKVLYPLDELLSEMGGLIGLIVGASAISFVEIIVYLCLVIVKDFYFLNYKD